MSTNTRKIQIANRVITRAAYLLGSNEPIQIEPGDAIEPNSNTRNIAAVLQEFYLSAVHMIALLPCFYTQLQRRELSKDNEVSEDDPYKWIIPEDFLVAISVNNSKTGFALFGDRLSLGTTIFTTSNSIEPQNVYLNYVSKNEKTFSDIFMTMCAYKLAEFAAPSVRGEASSTWFRESLKTLENRFGAHTSANYQIQKTEDNYNAYY